MKLKSIVESGELAENVLLEEAIWTERMLRWAGYAMLKGKCDENREGGGDDVLGVGVSARLGAR